MPAPHTLDQIGVPTPAFMPEFSEWCELCDAADDFKYHCDRVAEIVEEWCEYDCEEEFV